jgi:pyruvate,orthophosphate dikinase
MPGMMDTVLNIGITDESVHGLAKQSGNERFAWDAYRRLVQMFGKTVLGIDGDAFEDALDEAKHAKGTTSDLDLDAVDLSQLTERFKEIVREHTRREFPQDPHEQMDLAIQAVFNSWNSSRAVLYRRQERIPADLGTAVNVVAMVFGNLGADSGTGVALTRDPSTGQQGIYGDYLQNAQGEDVVAGSATPSRRRTERLDPASTGSPVIMETLENHYRDLCDIEFTIERASWCCRLGGQGTAAAAFRIATSSWTGPDRHGRGGHPGTGTSPPSSCSPASTSAVTPRRSPPGSARHPAPPSARPCSTRPGLSSRPRRARTPSWSAGRPTPTTCTA